MNACSYLWNYIRQTITYRGRGARRVNCHLIADYIFFSRLSYIFFPSLQSKANTIICYLFTYFSIIINNFIPNGKLFVCAKLKKQKQQLAFVFGQNQKQTICHILLASAPIPVTQTHVCTPSLTH